MKNSTDMNEWACSQSTDILAVLLAKHIGKGIDDYAKDGGPEVV